MDDANVHANGAGNGISGGGKLVVRNSWLSASGGHDAIAGLGDFKVEGCTLRDPSDGRIVSSGVLASEEAYETYASFVRIEPIRYDLWIKGTQVAAVNYDDVLGDGSCEYDPSNHTLYLYTTRLFSGPPKRV